MATESELIRERKDTGRRDRGPQAPEGGPTFDGVPLRAYVAQEQALNKEGMTMLTDEDGNISDDGLSVYKDGSQPYTGEIWNPATNEYQPQRLNAKAGSRPLFDKRNKPADNPYDWESALIEVAAVGKPEQLEQRYAENKAGHSNMTPPKINDVGNEALAQFRQLQVEGHLNKNIEILTRDQLEQLTDEDKVEYLNSLMSQVDARDASNRLFYAMNIARHFGTDIDAVKVDQMEKNLSIEASETMRQAMLNEANEELQSEVYRLVAQQQWSGVTHATLDIAVQELVPIQNVGLKVFFLGKMMDYLGMPEEGRPFNTGDRRQQIRNWIAEVGPAEAVKQLREFRGWVEEQQKSNPLFRQYLVLEQYEAIFSDEFMATGNPIDNMDKWFGRFETAMEAVATGWLLGRASWKGFKGIFGATDRSVMNRAARAVGARQAQTEMNRIVQGELAEKMGIEPGEAALNLMPRPSQLVDDRTVVLPGVADTVERGETIISRILDAARGSLSRVFTPSERQAIYQAEIDALKLGDNARVAPAMSTWEALDDGINIRAIITKNGEEAYSSLDEVAIDMAIIDPAMDNLRIMYRGDNGKLKPLDISREELARIVDNNPRSMTDEDLELMFDDAMREGREFEALQYEQELTRRTGEPSVSGPVLDAEYFIEFEHFRAYHPMDKVAFGDGGGAFRSTNPVARVLNSPNGKFVGDISEATMQASRDEARINRLFKQLYRPFYSLNAKSQRVVGNVFEWSEAQAKTLGRDPDLAEILAEFPDLTKGEIGGLISVRQGMDAQYAVLNRRLWREYNGLGYKSAVPNDPNMPTFHGKLDSLDDMQPGTYYDPTSQTTMKLTKADIEQLKAGGARTMKLDQRIDIPGTKGQKQVSKVVLMGEDYKVGKLSDDVLERYPGYRYRFYQDPYYIIRRRNGVEVDGVVRNEVTEQAMRTAPSQLDAVAYLNRGRFRKTVDENGVPVWRDKHGAEYVIVPSKQLDQADQMLRQREVLQTDGRLFWDKRNQKALKDTSGNDAELMDFSKALDEGTSMVTRQNTHEDMLRTLKNALLNEYKLPELQGINRNTKSLTQIVDDLKTARNNSTGNPELMKKYNEAISLANYIRQMEGIDSKFVTQFRVQMLKLAHWIDKIGNKAGLKPGRTAWLERAASTADPLAAMRQINFAVFMTFRAGRQILLQASQPLFLAGIDPVYVLSGKGLLDTITLRNALGKHTKVAFADDGMSWKARAKLMGLTEKELRVLTRELERSGVVDVVDLHSFSAGIKKGDSKKTTQGPVRHLLQRTTDAAKKYGFDLGEEINKVATFNIAYRRIMKQKGYKSLTELTKEDWVKVADDTENLSFAMNKAGAFRYQSGAWSLATQFMSFSHKFTLALAGQNPALSGKEVRRIWAGGIALYGANFVGLRNWTREALISLGYDDTWIDTEIGDTGQTPLDLISGGAIQTVANGLGNLTSEDYKDMNFATVGPTMNYGDFAGMFVENILRSDLGIGAVALGPFNNRASGLMQAAEFAHRMVTGVPNESPVDKAVWIADMFGKKIFPQFNDATMAWLAWKFDRLMTSNGNVQQIGVSNFNVLMRGVFGMRTLEEEADFDRRAAEWDFEEEKADIIKEGRRFVKQYVNLFRTGDVDVQTLMDVAAVVGEIAKAAPAGMQEEIISGIMLEKIGDDPRETPLQQLLDATINLKMDKSTVKALLMDISGDEQQREMLETFIDEVWDEKVMNREEMTERLIQQNSR